MAAIFASTSPRARRASPRVASARCSRSPTCCRRSSASSRSRSRPSSSSRMPSRARPARSKRSVSTTPEGPASAVPSGTVPRWAGTREGRQRASGSATTSARRAVRSVSRPSRSSPSGWAPARTPREPARLCTRRSSASSRSIRAGSADHTASAAFTTSSTVAYQAFIRSISSARLTCSTSRAGAPGRCPPSGRAPPGTVTAVPLSSSLSSASSGPPGLALRARTARAEASASE